MFCEIYPQSATHHQDPQVFYNSKILHPWSSIPDHPDPDVPVNPPKVTRFLHSHVEKNRRSLSLPCSVVSRSDKGISNNICHCSRVGLFVLYLFVCLFVLRFLLCFWAICQLILSYSRLKRLDLTVESEWIVIAPVDSAIQRVPEELDRKGSFHSAYNSGNVR